MNEKYLQHLAEDRRLCMLKLLADAGGSANERVLGTSLEMLGHTRQSEAAIREDIQFLVSNGLVNTQWFAGFQVCTITKRGVEAIEGRITVEGIKKPSLGE